MKLLLLVAGMVALSARPAWAHPSTTPHLHGSEISLVLASVVGFALVLRLWRGRSRVD